MDTNIKERQSPLPYPETPSVAEWHAENAPQPIQAQPQDGPQ